MDAIVINNELIADPELAAVVAGEIVARRRNGSRCNAVHDAARRISDRAAPLLRSWRHHHRLTDRWTDTPRNRRRDQVLREHSRDAHRLRRRSDVCVVARAHRLARH